MGEVTDISDALGGRISPPSAISSVHDLSQFRCGNEALDDWLKFRALKSEGKSARTYVVAQGRQVISYYAMSTGAAVRKDVPPRLGRNMPESVPLILLGRLAVDANHQGTGLGGNMLRDALQRSAQLSQIAGARGVLVHAIDRNAMAFYVKYGFLEFPGGSKTMFLPMETIIKGLG
ncbi:GNAT family N-acetyltransferase [Bradyrhizobium sp. SRS-191]|uniref:GNAT family N-acetyltransferase n=1 Tax=Bradyrhizobium sp. SRS-191 TaxID=2962606 RepID=UPI00211F1238|nr:GNAT family N-acetyltransferase [Bradyrhizobium sp. SRS-191]